MNSQKRLSHSFLRTEKPFSFCIVFRRGEPSYLYFAMRTDPPSFTRKERVELLLIDIHDSLKAVGIQLIVEFLQCGVEIAGSTHR